MNWYVFDISKKILKIIISEDFMMIRIFFFKILSKVSDHQVGYLSIFSHDFSLMIKS